MPRREGFDEEAMERKIKLNLDAGFTMLQIREKLMEELKELQEAIMVKEARAMEVYDQLDYILEKHG